MIKPRSLTQKPSTIRVKCDWSRKKFISWALRSFMKSVIDAGKDWYIWWLINSSRAFTLILAAIQPLHSNSNDGTMTRQKSIQVHPCINNWSWRVVECSSQITAGGNWTPLNMHCTDDRNETLLVSNSMAFLMKSTKPYFITHWLGYIRLTRYYPTSWKYVYTLDFAAEKAGILLHFLGKLTKPSRAITNRRGINIAVFFPPNLIRQSSIIDSNTEWRSYVCFISPKTENIQ